MYMQVQVYENCKCTWLVVYMDFRVHVFTVCNPVHDHGGILVVV